MKSYCRIVALFITLVVSGGYAENRAEDLRSREHQIHRIESELDSLRSARAATLSQADDLAQKIDLLRSRDLLSPGEHRELEKCLRESQRLETAVRGIDGRITDLSLRHEETVQSFLEELRTAITQTLQAIESAGEENIDLSAHLQELILKKESFETRLRVQASAGSIYHVDALPWDTPRQLRTKGDLLLDQEESVREEIDRVDRRIAALVDEENVRRKVSELVSEMDVFDENEELLGRETAVLGGISDGAEAVFNEVRDGASIQAWSAESLATSSMTLSDEMTRPAPRSADLIHEWISRLRDYRDNLNTRADSLNIRARWFHDEADKKDD